MAMIIDIHLVALALTGPWADKSAQHPVVIGLHLPRRGIAFREARRLADVQNGKAHWERAARREQHLLRENVELPLTLYAEFYLDTTRTQFDRWMQDLFDLGVWAAGSSAAGAVANPLHGRLAKRALDSAGEAFEETDHPDILAAGESVLVAPVTEPFAIEVPLYLRDTLREPDQQPARPRGKRPGRRPGKLLARAGVKMGNLSVQLRPLP